MKCTLVIKAPPGIQGDMRLYEVELPSIPPFGTTLSFITPKCSKNGRVFHVNVTGCEITLDSETRTTNLVLVFAEEDKGRPATLEDWEEFEETSVDA